jgi:N-acetylglutamate synthase-like GNAT family acetyltransferase
LLWKEQSPKQVKLSILFVGQEFRSRQVGESLMLYSLQQWYKKKYESVFVKTSEQDLINFFEKFGFSLQGIRRSIYDRNRKNEYILSKKFIYEKEIDPALIKVK